MPLLRKQQPQSRSSASSQMTADQESRQQTQLCESPLFGIRRQLPIQSPGSSNATTIASSRQQIQQTTTRRSSSSQPTPVADISSVPKQITRQQIHYAFSMMDTNKDGLIDLRDLSQMLANLGVPIDESILSHIMSSVSKRVDHRVSETEFLDWISHFIQVSETATSSPNVSPASASKHRRKPETLAGTGRIFKSASSSLAARAPEDQPAGLLRNRRGSGSGLALMRSLSSGSTLASMAGSPAGEPQLTETTGSGRSSSPGDKQHGDDLEARNDLKAAFCVFDLDGDGFITVDEVRAGLKLLGENWTPDELKQLFSSCRSSGQSASPQRISIDDFVQLLL